MNTVYNTEIIEKSARNSKYCYATIDGEQLQKNRIMGKLYDQVSDYYTKLINEGKARISCSYYIEDNEIEYIHCGIFDIKTGEQIL